MAGVSMVFPSSSRANSLVEDSWELIDPCPDLHALFLQFNDQFFWGKLAGCEVRWSPRMTLCAGLCCYEGRGGLCSIRLSQPLLKLRPRKDLVQTLLHEMIHAYLFVTENNRDHDGHGPNFHSHMHRINAAAGTKISVYHSFHAEVAVYKQHWWRCEGPCKDRKPYFGWVKRSTNRAPSSNDFWWSDHEKNCGGKYIKVKEPEGYRDPKKKGGPTLKSDTNKPKTISEPDKKAAQKEITSFFGKGYVLGTGKSTGINSQNSVSSISSVSKPTAKSKVSRVESPPNKRTRFDIDIFGKSSSEGVSLDSKGSLIDVIDLDKSTEAESPSSSSDTKVPCPVCAVKQPLTEINRHLDLCLSH